MPSITAVTVVLLVCFACTRDSPVAGQPIVVKWDKPFRLCGSQLMNYVQKFCDGHYNDLVVQGTVYASFLRVAIGRVPRDGSARSPLTRQVVSRFSRCICIVVSSPHYPVRRDRQLNKVVVYENQRSRTLYPCLSSLIEKNVSLPIRGHKQPRIQWGRNGAVYIYA